MHLLGISRQKINRSEVIKEKSTEVDSKSEEVEIDIKKSDNTSIQVSEKDLQTTENITKKDSESSDDSDDNEKPTSTRFRSEGRLRGRDSLRGARAGRRGGGGRGLRGRREVRNTSNKSYDEPKLDSHDIDNDSNTNESDHGPSNVNFSSSSHNSWGGRSSRGRRGGSSIIRESGRRGGGSNGNGFKGRGPTLSRDRISRGPPAHSSNPEST